MAYDPAIHDFDPQTGFMIDKRTGTQAYLAGLPHTSTHADPEWPKWVSVHESHLIKGNGDDAAPTGVKGWPHHHIGRDGAATVLVANEDEEERATGEWQEPKGDDAEAIDPRIMREVEADFDRVAADQVTAESRKASEGRWAAILEEAKRRTKDHHELVARHREETTAAVNEGRANVDTALGSNAADRRAALGADHIPPAPPPAGAAAVAPTGEHDVIDDASNKVVRGGAAPFDSEARRETPKSEPESK